MAQVKAKTKAKTSSKTSSKKPVAKKAETPLGKYARELKSMTK